MKCFRAALVVGLCVSAHPILSHAQKTPPRSKVRTQWDTIELGRFLEAIVSQQDKFVILVENKVDLTVDICPEELNLKGLTPEKQLKQVAHFLSLNLTKPDAETFLIRQKPKVATK